MIDESATAQTTGPPIAFTVSVGQILEFASTFQSEPAVAAMAEALKDAAGKDKVSITAKALERGVQYRIEVGEAVLSLIGQATRMQANANEF